MKSLVRAGLLLALGVPSLAQAEQWVIDPVHSSVSFKIRHFFTQVPGRFADLAGTIRYDPGQPESAAVEATIDAASIDTGNEKRDNHLRSADFFDVEAHPRITFRSTGIRRQDDRLVMAGDLTIRGVTRPVNLDVEFLGAMNVPWGGRVAGFSASGTVSRKDFGMTWNKILNTGATVLGDEVAIRIDIEAGSAEE